MATKSGNKGRYICKVGYLDIYAKDSLKPKKETIIFPFSDDELIVKLPSNPDDIPFVVPPTNTFAPCNGPFES